MCNCPIFIDARIWGEALKFSWDIFLNRGFRAPDMCSINLSFLQFNSYDKTITLPGIQWLSTNEQALKPYMRAVERRGKLYTESGIPIFSYHGQYYKGKWRECQLNNRHNCAAGYLKATECSDNMAKGSMNLLYTIFKKMCFEHKIKIEIKNYVHPEQTYEEEHGKWE
jgi:hypothetical protein